MQELKPCHVCGEKPRISGCRTLCGYWCMVTHADADHCVWVTAEAETEEKAKALAIEKWNRRHYPAEVQQAVERRKPKKITYDDSSLGKPGVPEFWIAYCPECKQPIDFNDTPFEFCRRCGQRLKWGE